MARISGARARWCMRAARAARAPGGLGWYQPVALAGAPLLLACVPLPAVPVNRVVS